MRSSSASATARVDGASGKFGRRGEAGGWAVSPEDGGVGGKGDAMRWRSGY